MMRAEEASEIVGVPLSATASIIASEFGVVVPFPSIASPAEGSATLTPTQVADLMAGKWYVNIHTAKNPGGEIRGQMMAN